MSGKYRIARSGFVIAAIFGALSMFVPLVVAVGPAISQGFTVDSSLPSGTIVSLKSDGAPDLTTAANTMNADRLVGVVNDSSLVELSGAEASRQVTISGSAPVLVSDINGEVKRGDMIAPSPIRGVGMKATESGQVIGTAQEDLSAQKDLSTRMVSDKQGVQQTVKIGRIETQVKVAYYQAPEDEFAFLPAFLLQFANAIAGRDVAPIRVLAALVVMIAGFGSVAVLLYSSVRSSIISIGRNPLSEQAVRKGLLEVIGLALGILLIMLIAIYLILIL